MAIMSVFATIPVKKISKSKTRLSEVLNPEERQTLTLTMLEDVLKAVAKSRWVHKIVVVSSDFRVQEFTENSGAIYLPEERRGLSHAVEQATQWCIQKDARSILFLPADIPLIRSSDVNQILELGSGEMTIVMAPSADGGTNALLQKPPDLIPLHFGLESFNKHLAEASSRGILAKVYRSRNVTIDIDSPTDLKKLLRIDAQTSSHRFLKQIALDTRLRRCLEGMQKQ